MAGAMGGAYGTRKGLQTGFAPEYWGVSPEDATYLPADNMAFATEYGYDEGGHMNYPWGRPAIMAGRGLSKRDVARRHSAASSERDYF